MKKETTKKIQVEKQAELGLDIVNNPKKLEEVAKILFEGQLVHVQIDKLAPFDKQNWFIRLASYALKIKFISLVWSTDLLDNKNSPIGLALMGDGIDGTEYEMLDDSPDFNEIVLTFPTGAVNAKIGRDSGEPFLLISDKIFGLEFTIQRLSTVVQ